jgi:hypothetical protein
VVCDIRHTVCHIAHSTQLYMGVAADCEYVSHYGSRSNASHQILTVWNTATALYKVRERGDIFFITHPHKN